MAHSKSISWHVASQSPPQTEVLGVNADSGSEDVSKDTIIEAPDQSRSGQSVPAATTGHSGQSGQSGQSGSRPGLVPGPRRLRHKPSLSTDSLPLSAQSGSGISPRRNRNLYTSRIAPAPISGAGAATDSEPFQFPHRHSYSGQGHLNLDTNPLEWPAVGVVAGASSGGGGASTSTASVGSTSSRSSMISTSSHSSIPEVGSPTSETLSPLPSPYILSYPQPTLQDVFIALAHKERRVLEAREGLHNAQIELAQFKERWKSILTAPELPKSASKSPGRLLDPFSPSRRSRRSDQTHQSRDFDLGSPERSPVRSPGPPSAVLSIDAMTAAAAVMTPPPKRGNRPRKSSLLFDDPPSIRRSISGGKTGLGINCTLFDDQTETTLGTVDTPQVEQEAYDRVVQQANELDLPSSPTASLLSSPAAATGLPQQQSSGQVSRVSSLSAAYKPLSDTSLVASILGQFKALLSILLLRNAIRHIVAKRSETSLGDENCESKAVRRYPSVNRTYYSTAIRSYSRSSRAAASPTKHLIA